MELNPYSSSASMFVPGLDEKPKLDVMLFLQNLLILSSIIFLYWIIDSQATQFNATPIGIFRPGGILLTFFLLASIGMTWKAIAQLLENYAGVRKILKWGIFLLFVGIAVGVYFEPQPFTGFYYSEGVQNQINKLEPVRYIYGYHAEYAKEEFQSSTVSVSDKYKLTATQISTKLHDAINFERRKIGLNLIGYDARLEAIATAHARDMLQRNYFDHVSPEGNTYISRYQKANYSCEIVSGNETIRGGENLAQSSTFNSKYPSGLISDYKSVEEIANQTITEWMASASHRSNILRSYWRNEGIGIAIEPDGKVLIVQNFC